MLKTQLIKISFLLFKFRNRKSAIFNFIFQLFLFLSKKFLFMISMCFNCSFFITHKNICTL